MDRTDWPGDCELVGEQFVTDNAQVGQRPFSQNPTWIPKRDILPMTLSVNTNRGAFLALQSLTKTTNQLAITQLRVTTGLRVNGPKDDAATFAIANTLRGDIAGNQALKIALANGESTVNVAIEAGKAISDLLVEMKAKVVQANQAGLDANSRTALRNDYDALRLQIKTIVATVEFNGVNLIKTAATDLAVLSTVDGSTITVTAQDISVTALGISASNLTSSASANLALTAINTAIATVSNGLASLGASAKRVEIQAEFTVKLIDILKVGVGSLVDANLAEESANLTSLQIKQQLGVQALAIANAGPQSVLALFQ